MFFMSVMYITVADSAADRGGRGGGEGGQQGQFAPGPQCKGAPKQCQRQSHSSLASLRGWFHCIFD